MDVLTHSDTEMQDQIAAGTAALLVARGWADANTCHAINSGAEEIAAEDRCVALALRRALAILDKIAELYNAEGRPG